MRFCVQNKTFHPKMKKILGSYNFFHYFCAKYEETTNNYYTRICSYYDYGSEATLSPTEGEGWIAS